MGKRKEPAKTAIVHGPQSRHRGKAAGRGRGLAPKSPPASSSTFAGSTAEKGARKSGGRASFPVVGIGASAGGLEAFTELLQHLPTDTGMSFVLGQHRA